MSNCMPCCLCGNPDALYVEQRRSGNEGQVASWSFCLACWRELQTQREDTDPEICQRYNLFLKFIAGNYNVKRMFSGVRASTIALHHQGENNLVDSQIRLDVLITHDQGKIESDYGPESNRSPQGSGCPGETLCVGDNRGNLLELPETLRGLPQAIEQSEETITLQEADPPGGDTPDGS